MNWYKVRDFLFGRDKKLLTAIEHLLNKNVVRKDSNLNPFIWFEDKTVSKDESVFTVDQLYDYFRRFLSMKLNHTVLLPPYWARNSSDNLYSLRTGSDVENLITKLQALWDERALEAKYLPAIESFFNNHTLVELDIWPLYAYQVLPHGATTDKNPVDFRALLEFLYTSECRVSLDGSDVYVIYGLSEGPFRKHGTEIDVPKGLGNFCSKAIPLIGQKTGIKN